MKTSSINIAYETIPNIDRSILLLSSMMAIVDINIVRIADREWDETWINLLIVLHPVTKCNINQLQRVVIQQNRHN